MLEGLVALLAVLVALWFFILLPAQMASNRNRSAVLWVLVSLIASPILAILLLALLGKVLPVSGRGGTGETG